MKTRIGMGYDVHRLVQGRQLWLGGILIPHTMGLLGHSDADVLLHAICDAMLGAANMRDIGYHFPDTAQKPKLSPYIGQMRECIAAVLETDPDNVSVKATTTERLGFVGQEEGISAYAVVLIEKYE